MTKEQLKAALPITSAHLAKQNDGSVYLTKQEIQDELVELQNFLKENPNALSELQRANYQLHVDALKEGLRLRDLVK